MNMSKCLHNRKRGLPVGILCLVMILVWPSWAYGQERFDDICNDPDTHERFVQTSRNRVRDGADIEKVLNTLDCIVMAHNGNSGAGGLVVEVLFHIAKDNPIIQEHLLRIIAEKGIDYNSLYSASRLIVYVIDKSGLEQLRKLAEADSPVGAPPCNSNERCWRALEVLVEVGDVKALPLLKRFLENLPPELEYKQRWLELLKLKVKKISIQQSVGDMLRALESSDHILDRDSHRGWLVRQAVRHGATREQVRAAACNYMRNNKPTRSNGRHFYLIQACEEYKLFKAGDVAEFEAIRRRRQSVENAAQAFTVDVSWATQIDAKRAAFYKIPYTLPEPGQRTPADPRRRPPYDWQE